MTIYIHLKLFNKVPHSLLLSKYFLTSYGINSLVNIVNNQNSFSRVSSTEKNPEFKTLEMRDLKLPKYAFGFKVKSFLSMLGWTGMILAIFGVLSALLSIVISQEFDCFDILPCGLIFGLEAVSLAFAIIWFCLNLFLRKRNNKDDLIRVTEILKINCYAQESLPIVYSVIILVFFDAIKHLHNLDFILYPVTILTIIVSILMIIGVAFKNPKLLIVYIVIAMTSVILFIFFILGFSIYLSWYIISGIPFLLGLIAFFANGLFSVYWMGYVVTLMTIMKKMNQVRNY